jgi:hypothetical protein
MRSYLSLPPLLPFWCAVWQCGREREREEEEEGGEKVARRGRRGAWGDGGRVKYVGGGTGYIEKLRDGVHEPECRSGLEAS